METQTANTQGELSHSQSKTHLLSHSHTHSVSHSFVNCNPVLTRSLTHSLAQSIIHPFGRSLTHKTSSLSHSLTQRLPQIFMKQNHSLTCSFAHLSTHQSLKQSLVHSQREFTHWLCHSLTLAIALSITDSLYHAPIALSLIHKSISLTYSQSGHALTHSISQSSIHLRTHPHLMGTHSQNSNPHIEIACSLTYKENQLNHSQTWLVKRTHSIDNKANWQGKLPRPVKKRNQKSKLTH